MILPAGIGFTVSLLVADLSLELGNSANVDAKFVILAASVLAAVITSILLGSRNRQYKKLQAQEAIDADDDGIQDVYQNEK